MHCNRKPFGTLPDGTVVEELTLTAGALSCSLLTYGGALRTLSVPNCQGTPVDVVLGFDTLEDYQAHTSCMGALIGRYGNRIGGASFTLHGVDYPLFANNGPNHLHGGKIGFNKRVWDVVALTQSQAVLALHSPHMEEGYPGNLDVEVTYTLTGDGLSIRYHATCDQDTLCNLTNHAYFNLEGHGAGNVGEHMITLHASHYTPTDPASIPNGDIASVEGTPMDLRTATPMGAQWDADFDQLTWAGGYDHNWVLDGTPGTLRSVAKVTAPQSGIAMEVLTTCPGVQFYTGNYVESTPKGKGGVVYGKRHGFCLETQHFPDSPHHANFPTTVLKPGEVYQQETIYRFF